MGGRGEKFEFEFLILAPSHLPPPILVSRSAPDGNAACAGELDLGNEFCSR